jgi:hypothetical protein
MMQYIASQAGAADHRQESSNVRQSGWRTVSGEILEAVVLHVVTTVRGKTVNGKRIADTFNRSGNQRGASRVSCRTVLSEPPSVSLVDSDRSSSNTTERSRFFSTLRMVIRGLGCSPMRITTMASMAALISISSPSSMLRTRCTPSGVSRSIICLMRCATSLSST